MFFQRSNIVTKLVNSVYNITSTLKKIDTRLMIVLELEFRNNYKILPKLYGGIIIIVDLGNVKVSNCIESYLVRIF